MKLDDKESGEQKENELISVFSASLLPEAELAQKVVSSDSATVQSWMADDSLFDQEDEDTNKLSDQLTSTELELISIRRTSMALQQQYTEQLQKQELYFKNERIKLMELLLLFQQGGKPTEQQIELMNKYNIDSNMMSKKLEMTLSEINQLKHEREKAETKLSALHEELDQLENGIKGKREEWRHKEKEIQERECAVKIQEEKISIEGSRLTELQKIFKNQEREIQNKSESCDKLIKAKIDQREAQLREEISESLSVEIQKETFEKAKQEFCIELEKSKKELESKFEQERCEWQEQSNKKLVESLDKQEREWNMLMESRIAELERQHEQARNQWEKALSDLEQTCRNNAELQLQSWEKERKELENRVESAYSSQKECEQRCRITREEEEAKIVDIMKCNEELTAKVREEASRADILERKSNERVIELEEKLQCCQKEMETINLELQVYFCVNSYPHHRKF